MLRGSMLLEILLITDFVADKQPNVITDFFADERTLR